MNTFIFGLCFVLFSVHREEIIFLQLLKATMRSQGDIHQICIQLVEKGFSFVCDFGGFPVVWYRNVYIKNEI